MNTTEPDNFATAARAEAVRWWTTPQDNTGVLIENLGLHMAVWARDHLAAEIRKAPADHQPVHGDPVSTKGRCPFCRKIRQGRDRHGKVTDEGAGVVSFDPLGPVASGHRLFVPRIHVTAAGHNPGAAASAFASAAAYAVKHGIREYNLIQSNGPAATQTVPHVHVHLVPRHEGDGLALPWTNPKDNP